VLARLGMKPMEAGLSIIAAYDKESILARDILALDLEEYKQNITKVFMQALSLACEAEFVTPESAPLIIGKAWKQAYALAIKSEYVTPETIKRIVQNAHAEMVTLANAVAVIKKEAAPRSVAS